ncbi:MAG: PilZ domain-containing protein [Candidatus Omnitrophota bacterium]
MIRDKRRIYKRVLLNNEAKLSRLEGPGETNVSIVDISMGGVRVIMPMLPPRVDSLVKIKMIMQDKEVSCLGAVRWGMVMRMGMGSLKMFDVGIEFKDIAEEERKIIAATIEAVSSRQRQRN